MNLGQPAGGGGGNSTIWAVDTRAHGMRRVALELGHRFFQRRRDQLLGSRHPDIDVSMGPWRRSRRVARRPPPILCPPGAPPLHRSARRCRRACAAAPACPALPASENLSSHGATFLAHDGGLRQVRPPRSVPPVGTDPPDSIGVVCRVRRSGYALVVHGRAMPPTRHQKLAGSGRELAEFVQRLTRERGR